jgi:predicted nucleic acid-binding protein
MVNAYIDTSALIKYYPPENGASEVIRIIEELTSRHSISRLSLVETVSAFAVKFRLHGVIRVVVKDST